MINEKNLPFVLLIFRYSFVLSALVFFVLQMFRIMCIFGSSSYHQIVKFCVADFSLFCPRFCVADFSPRILFCCHFAYVALDFVVTFSVAEILLIAASILCCSMRENWHYDFDLRSHYQVAFCVADIVLISRWICVSLRPSFCVAA
jgi:hypothetical protein